MAPPDWQPWQTATFLDAQRRRRPVLLLLEAAWSPASADAHARVLARPDVAALIGEATIPVRVDVDRRPDIADRYGLGHWPSLLLLTPDGDVLTGGTRLDDTLAARLRAAVDAFAASEDWPSRVTGTSPKIDRQAAPAEVLDDPAAGLLATIRAGVGALAQPPADGATALAVLCTLAEAAITSDPAVAGVAAAVLDDAAHSFADHDDVAAVAPRRLEDEAEWVRVLARAVRLEPVPAWQAHLARRLATLRTFQRSDGHWRPWTGAGRVILVDASARACRALLAAATALDDDELAREAIGSLETLAPVAYARGAGVAHVLEEGRPHGPLLLDDAMVLAQAALDADQWRDGPVYRDLAEELLETALARLAHQSGALVDRVGTLAGAGRVGRLAEPHFPLAGNAEAARLLVRVHGTGPDVIGRARRLLMAIDAEAREAGLFAAPVGLAWIGLDRAGAPTTAW